MKTKTILLLMLTISVQSFTAQTLNKKVKQSVEKLEGQINLLSKEEITKLDQIAFNIRRQITDNKKSTVLFIDKDNTEQSQLAMIWLNAAFLFYDIKADAQSAGVSPNIEKPLSNVMNLSKYGFVTKVKNTEKAYQYEVKYSPRNSWLIFSKGIEDLKLDRENTIIIIVDDSEINDNNLKIRLNLSEDDNLSLKMTYIAAQINHLNKIEN